MARIVDVECYLQQFSWSTEVYTPIRLRVKDPIAPWNDGVFELSGKGVRKIESEAEKVIRLTINQLSALMLGYKTVKELAEVEAIQGNPDELDQLESIIPTQNTYFPDFF